MTTLLNKLENPSQRLRYAYATKTSKGSWLGAQLKCSNNITTPGHRTNNDNDDPQNIVNITKLLYFKVNF